MSVGDLLNTDVEAIGARAADGWRWWLHELRDMARPLVTQRGAGWTVIAEPEAGGGYRFRDAEGRPVPADAKARPVLVLLSPDEALVRDLPAPRVPERDVLQTVRLDLDRLTPFGDGAAYHRISLLPVEGDEERPAVRIASVSRSQADRRLDEAQASGLKVAALAARARDGAYVDFLPEMKGAAGPSRRTVVGWSVVALLVAANIGLTVWRDMGDVASLRAQVDAQRPAAQRARAMRMRTAAIEGDLAERTRALVEGDPLRALAALSRTLPSGAAVRRLSWSRSEVHMVGARRRDEDMLGALRADPLFRNARNTSADAAQPDDAFDITAPLGRAAQVPAS